jgi:ABC-2 type transport system ATP-binding protein
VSAIELDDAGKRYVKYEDEPMLVSRALRVRTGARHGVLWALRVDHGECVGVIGRNGSGKSTLLQMLAGVTAPTEGRVAVRGRIAPLVSVGVGFHPELTGRENIYVNGTILGLTGPEIARRLDSIVAFSGIERFIDTPVKFYSSGMFVRLGFSVAVEATPDVLLVDEVLAVGDIAFQLRCFQRMQEIRAAGTTIVVVSHNLNAIRQLCDRALVIHDGIPRLDASVDEGIALYHQLLGEDGDPDADDSGLQIENGVAKVIGLRMVAADGRETTNVESGDAVAVEATVRFDRDVAHPVLGFAVLSAAGINIHSTSNLASPFGPVAAGSTHVLRARLRLPLATGSYLLRAGVHRVDDEFYASTQLDEAPAVSFYVTGSHEFGGLVDLGASFDSLEG